MIRDTGWHPPVLFAPELDASSANIRGVTFSQRFTKPYLIQSAAITFEDNTNDTVRVRLWLTDGTTTRTVTASSESSAGTVPTGGRNLLAGGGSVDYITGDGPDAIPIPIGLETAGGFFLAVDVDNQDTPNVHAVRVHFYLRELI